MHTVNALYSQLIMFQITNCWIIQSNYIAKYSPRPINCPLKPLGLWNVGLLGVGLILEPKTHKTVYNKEYMNNYN